MSESASRRSSVVSERPELNFAHPGNPRHRACSHSVIGLIVLLGAATLISGCSNFFDHSAPDLKLPPAAFHDIDPMDLSKVSRTAPQTPEQAQVEADANPPVLQMPVNAAAEVKMSLTQCRALALENNLDLSVSLLTPEITRESITQEQAQFDAVFFANARHVKLDTPTDSQLNGSSLDSTTADAGVTIPLRTGGTITLDLPLSRTQTDNIFATLNPSYTSDFSASISQPLLRNAGVRTNTNGIRIAQYQTDLSQAEAKLAVINALAGVDRVYWTLYASRQLLDVRKEEYQLAVALLESARRRVKQGAAAEVEVVRAESGVAEKLQAIIEAQNAVSKNERDLKRIMHKPGLGMETGTVVILETTPNPLHFTLDRIDLANLAVSKRMEMLELQVQLAMDASNVDYRKNQLLPLLTLDYTYNINGLGDSFDRSLHVLGDKHFEDHTVGLTLQMPLGNRAAQSLYDQAILTRVQHIATRTQRTAQIQQEVFDALDALEANWQRILASRQATVLAYRTLQAEQRQFDLGLQTATDVLNAQTTYSNAKADEISALTDYEICQVDIAYATGMLLGSDRIHWDEPKVDLTASGAR